MADRSHRRALGAWGERVAAGHLRRLGYAIVEQNYRCPQGEIDLVARQGDTLVFVEVRTRRTAAFGHPEESITPTKARHLVESAEAYLAERGLVGDWRIDFVAVELGRGGKVVRLEVIPNAVEESGGL